METVDIGIMHTLLHSEQHEATAPYAANSDDDYRRDNDEEADYDWYYYSIPWKA